MTPRENRSLYLFAFGAAFFTGVTGLFSNYLTDIGVSAAAVSLILLVTRVWDFVNDPIAGSIIERSKFRSGKYKPWLKIATVFLPITGLMMFLVPSSLPMWVKIVLPTVLFVIYEGVFTFVDIPLFGIRLVTTDSVAERTDVTSFLGIFAGLGLIVGSLAFPLLRPNVGWQGTAVVFAAVALATIVWYPRRAVERYAMKPTDPSIKDMLKAVFKNKQLLIFYASLLICMSTNFVQVVGLFTARHVFNDETFLTAIMLALLLPALSAGALIPLMAKKMDKFDIFRLSLIGFAVTGVISFFAGYENLTVVLILTAVRGVFLGVSSLLAYAFTPDMVEYGHYVSGERSEAVSFSFQTFTAKAITALLSVLMMAILSVLGFVSGEGAAQPELVVKGIWAMFTWLPGVGALVSLVGFQFYRIRDRKVQVMIRANHAEIGREAAEAELRDMGGY
jgi:Na+/melibiose symporter-like transporter